MRRFFAFLLLLALPFPLSSQVDDEQKKMQDEGRQIAQQFARMLGDELNREMDATGPMRAMLVCRYYAPEVASTLSRRSGWRVTRVSLRPRNPSLGQADAWEQKVLADLERRAAAGESADGLEHGEIVREPQGRMFRFMKAITMTPNCVGCHGSKQQISEPVWQELAREYPHDRAIGYAPGQVRGAVSVKRPL